MKRVRLSRFWSVAVGLLLAGCAGRSVNPAQLTPDELYQRASTFYEAEEYGRAIPLLEAFAQQHVGDERAPRARLLLGRAHMAKRDYITAATQFQRLIENYPTHPLNLEARSAICDAYVRLSPKPQLDQEYTLAAIAHCESVAANFPGTEEARAAAEQLGALNERLAEKVFGTGLFYQKRKAHDAAVVYFTDVVERFPRTSFAPRALRELLRTYRTIGYVEEADETRARLLRDYPESPEAQEVRALADGQ